MKLALVIVNFTTAALSLAVGILRLIKSAGQDWNIVFGIVWLVIGVIWLVTSFLNLKKYKLEKMNAKDLGDIDG